MVMKETTGMLQDDVRLVAARGKLLKDAIIKCYDSSFGPIPVQNIVKEELYEIRNLNIGQTGPEISLPSTAAAGKVTLPSGNKPVLVVFWDPQDMRSVQFCKSRVSPERISRFDGDAGGSRKERERRKGPVELENGYALPGG